MSGRPDILFPLFAGLETLQGVGAKTAQNMKNLGLEKPRDLLFSLPVNGVDRRLRRSVRGVLHRGIPRRLRSRLALITNRGRRGNLIA